MTRYVQDQTARVVVAVPCFNEAPAIASVVECWRSALPGAEVVVFDNGSTDDTGAVARGCGVRVIEVPTRGKGHAVRAIFEAFADRDAVILVDGDGTYPADQIDQLLSPVLAGEAEMTVGARKPVSGAGAMPPVRGLGNTLIRAAFRILIGPGGGDLLSGYRVFSRRFLAEIRPRSSGFEIEAELTSEAVVRRFRVIEVPVPYHARVVGTTSKLRALRDGRRILAMIAFQSLKWRPWRPLLLLALAAAAILGLVAWALDEPGLQANPRHSERGLRSVADGVEGIAQGLPRHGLFKKPVDARLADPLLVVQ